MGLVILSFNSHRGCNWCLDWLVGLLWVCWVFSGYLVGFILVFIIYFGFLVPVGFCWAEGSGGVVGMVVVWW